MSSKPHVAVLYGGWSPEREVSLDTGTACAQALERCGYQVTGIDAARDVAEVLTQLSPDVVFNALHGVWGEDGCVQGILETLQIPYTHSGVLASALAMDKHLARTIFAANDIPVAEAVVVSRHEAARRHVIQPPYVIKPVRGGSSVGVHIVTEDDELPPQAVAADDWPFDDDVLVEAFVAGRELTCAVMGDAALGVIDIVPATGYYDYEAKYVIGGSKHITPAELKPNIYLRIQKVALRAHMALGCRGVSRADFRYDDTSGGTGELVCLEVNTQPGMTETSLVPELAAHAGLSFEELVRWMVEDASWRR
ncbi:D-alanine--D-alanine ligase [hydrothermal vent metagenome]|uniref:D-alanine--D-alanine ligase n=1 Tax=hydrothermal vent metagenome TaxID=652676 RepID=A0A3B0THM2_9ZZZZ